TLEAQAPLVGHVSERSIRDDRVDGNHEQVRTGRLGEIDREMVEHAVEHIEVAHQMAAAQDCHDLVWDNGELDRPDFLDAGEEAILAHPPLPSGIRNDAEYHGPLALERRQIAIGQHRTDVVVKEVPDVFVAPDDAAHDEQIAVRMTLPDFGPP